MAKRRNMDEVSRKRANAGFTSKKRKTSIIYLGIFFIIIVAIIVGYFSFKSDGQSNEGGGIIGEIFSSQNPAGNTMAAPDFTLQDATGTNISLQDFKGKVVILHFMQILSDCHGGYFYKSDDRTQYDPSLSEYVSLTEIETIHQFEELKKIYNKYSSDDVVIISVVIPPGCCGDPLKFSKDMKNDYNLGWYVASDTMQYDTWYQYMDYLPYDSNHVLTNDPAILVLDKNQHVVYNSSYTDAATLGGN